jgi:zinc and cadmium transporter
VIGDSIHNFIDGVVIMAAFASSPSLGIATSIAVISHELPQEVGDFAILLNSGYSKRRAFTLNLLSSLTAILGAIAAYLFLNIMEKATPYIMAVAAASFLYIALADLVPGLSRPRTVAQIVRQSLLVAAGIATIVLPRFL